MSASEPQSPSPASHPYAALIDFAKRNWFYAVCIVYVTALLWSFFPKEVATIWRWVFIVSASIVVILMVIICLWYVPRWQTKHLHASAAHELFELENEARRTIAQILGGLLLLISLYFTWDNFKQTQESTQRSIAVAREGQITDRFNKAVAQLSEEKLQISVGGVYALERISRDSDTDHWAVVEELLLHLHAKAHINQPRPAEEAPAVGADIQAILTVLGRRPENYINNEPQGLDLSNLYLPGIKLDKSNFRNVVFSGSSLRGAHFKNANLNNAILTNADLTDAQLIQASLRGANLGEAVLTNANLEGVDLEDADLTSSKGLTFEQVQQAKHGLDPKLPPDLKQQWEEAQRKKYIPPRSNN